MLYPYATFPGYLIVTFSQVMKDKGPNGKEKVIVNFEQPDDEMGFKEARYSLPEQKLIYNDGFIDEEQRKNAEILERNAKLIMKYAKAGGVNFA